MRIFRAYWQHHAIPWWRVGWQCSFVKLRPTRNFRGKRDYGEHIRCCHITFNYNSLLRENQTPVQILSKDILVSMFIKKSHGRVRTSRFPDTLYNKVCNLYRYANEMVAIGIIRYTGHASYPEGHEFYIRPADGLFWKKHYLWITLIPSI
jgi:hypothetical protein